MVNEMNVFDGGEYAAKHDRDSGRIFSDFEFRNCFFKGCTLGMTRDVGLRSILRNGRVVNCSEIGSSIGPVLFDNVVVDGLNTNGQLFQAWGAAFKRVYLRGKIDRLMLSPFVVLSDPASTVNKSFFRSNHEFYAEVDWALDISTVEAKELEIQGVPACLIRRDPETQVVVTAKRAVEFSFDKLDYGGTHWKFSIQFMLSRGESDIVLVAPKRSPKFKAMLNILKMLRDEGIAEFD